MSDTLKAIAGVIVGLAVIAVIGLVSFWGGIFGNKVQANYQKHVVTAQVQQSVRTKEFAQAAYERFFKDCNDVVAMNDQIATAKQRVTDLSSLPDDQFGTKASKVADAVSDLAGLRQGQASVAAEYNASAAEYTRGQFRAASLPARLDPPYHYICQ